MRRSLIRLRLSTDLAEAKPATNKARGERQVERKGKWRAAHDKSANTYMIEIGL